MKRKLFSKLDIDFLNFRANDENISKDPRVFWFWPPQNLLDCWLSIEVPAGVRINTLHKYFDERYGVDSGRILVSKTFLENNLDFLLTQLNKGNIITVQSDKAPTVTFNNYFKELQ